MGKASIIVYIIAAVLILLFLSHTPKKHPTHRHRRLKLRSNMTTSRHPSHYRKPVAFDPLVADMERRHEDKQWGKEYFEHSYKEFAAHDSAPGEESWSEWEELMDAEDYLNDEGKFNVTDRLLLLFPKIDMDPIDGMVSEHELTEWNLQQARREILHRTQREMEDHDKNHDGFVSYSEYDPPSWALNAGNDSFGYDMGWWKEEHFNASDADGDGLLNLDELDDFLHPADSKNPKVAQWLCEEEVRERDKDKDGKINFDEFFPGLFDLVRNYDEESHNASHHSDNSMNATARMLFDQLDKDGDGHLSDVELLPIIGKAHPSERYYAKQHAVYMISQADADKDGRLTTTEMIENPYVFYSAIFNDDVDEYDDYHDELR